MQETRAVRCPSFEVEIKRVPTVRRRDQTEEEESVLKARDQQVRWVEDAVALYTIHCGLEMGVQAGAQVGRGMRGPE